MSLVYLNGEYLPIEHAKISPFDRGFLFGDGLYEVIPVHKGQAIGWGLHMSRLKHGLAHINLPFVVDEDAIKTVMQTLVKGEDVPFQGFYLHISRGRELTRQHGFSETMKPTVFAFTYAIAEPVNGTDGESIGRAVVTQKDLRWQRCHIKSTSLLGNVLHYQHGQTHDADETLLFNDNDQLTEGSTCNVFIVRGDCIITPELDQQKLPGITRALLLDVLRTHTKYRIQEGSIERAQVFKADEVWLTSSTKEILPVVRIDGQPVGKGRIGPVWRVVKPLFDKYKFSY